MNGQNQPYDPNSSNICSEQLILSIRQRNRS